MEGKLFLIPVPLGDNLPSEVLPSKIGEVVQMIDQYIAENEKTARKFIKAIHPDKQQSQLSFEILNKHTDEIDLRSFLDPCLNGKNMGLMSEAGVPAIADPGARIVRIAHILGIEVVPLVGPSSIILALMASGMNGQNFAFNGYLPIDSRERKNAIKFFEKRAMAEDQSQIFIETPYRSDKLMKELLSTLRPDTRLCIGTDLTLPTETIISRPVKGWMNVKEKLNKRPAVFVIGN